MTIFLLRAVRGPVIAGIGCSSAATAAEIVALVEASLAEAGFATTDLAAITSHERKSGHSGLNAAARHFGVPLRLLRSDELPEQVPNPSATVFAAIALPSIAEATAAAAGPLVLPKRKSAHATCALAQPLSQPVNAMAEMASSTLATSSAGP